MKQILRVGAWLALVLGIVLWASAPAVAQEHPEHPEAAESAEHPDHPEKMEVTKDSLADAVEKWVGHQTKVFGGYFLVWDSVDKTALVLTLDKVHRERVSKLEDEVYFACADFATKDGTVYDLDMFMAPEGGHLVATEVKVHKKEGKARYTWNEEDGVWKAKPAK
jgi:hypothetical protein